MRQRNVVEPLHLIAVLGLQRDHDAVADAGRVAVKRFSQADPRAAVWRAPRNETVEFHHPPDAQFAAQRVVKGRSAREVIGAERDIADHGFSPPNQWY